MERRGLRTFTILEDNDQAKARVRLPYLYAYNWLIKMRSVDEPKKDEESSFGPPRTQADLAQSLRDKIVTLQAARRAGRNKENSLKRLDRASKTSASDLTGRGVRTGTQAKTNRKRVRATRRRLVTVTVGSVMSSPSETDQRVQSVQNVVEKTEDTRPPWDISYKKPRPPKPVLLEHCVKSLEHPGEGRGDWLPTDVPKVVSVVKAEVLDFSLGKTQHGGKGQDLAPNLEQWSTPQRPSPTIGKLILKEWDYHTGTGTVHSVYWDPYGMGDPFMTERRVPRSWLPWSDPRDQSGEEVPRTNPVRRNVIDWLPTNSPKAVPLAKEDVLDFSPGNTRHGEGDQDKAPDFEPPHASPDGQWIVKEKHAQKVQVKVKSQNPYEMGGGLKTARRVPPSRHSGSNVREQSGGTPRTNPIRPSVGVGAPNGRPVYPPSTGRSSEILAKNESEKNGLPHSQNFSFKKRISGNPLTWFSKKFSGSKLAPEKTAVPPSKPQQPQSMTLAAASKLRRKRMAAKKGTENSERNHLGLQEHVNQERPRTGKCGKMAERVDAVTKLTHPANVDVLRVGDTEVEVDVNYTPRKKINVFKRLFSRHTFEEQPRPVSTTSAFVQEISQSTKSAPKKGLFGRLWNRVKNVRGERSARVAPMKQSFDQNP